MAERISIVTDEISQDLGEVREFLSEHRLPAVELRCVGGRRAPDLSARDLATLAAWARDRDPAVLAVSPGTFKCDLSDRPAIERQLRETFPRSIELAVGLGARFLVTFAFENREGLPLERGVEPLRAAADACAAAGLPLLVENEPGLLAGTARETARLLAAADHGNLFVNWDPTNGNELDRARLSRGLREVFPRVRHVHVKNGRLRPGERFARCGPLREGEIDWPAHLALLDELRYEGFLGVETHFEPRREGSAAVLAELREMIRETGFSWGRP